MAPRILGLHHVTATVDEAQPDLDFCIDLLGLRLVKKTVNFDNHNVFHFYYGTELGAPGTIWTTFPYAGYGVREGIKGTGQVITTAFSVPTGSLEFWRHRLKEKGVVVADIEAYFKEPAIAFSDPSGLRFELSVSEEGIGDFYRLHVRTRRRHGLPPQPFSFFRNVHQHVVKPGLGFVALARSGSRPVAAAVFFHLGRNAIYKFGASDERYQDSRPNNLVMWDAIQKLSDAKVEILHFGRTSLENEGLRRFKSSWGTIERSLEYFRFDVTSNCWTSTKDKSSGIHNALFKRLPLIANRLIGAAIYPHLD